MQINKSKGVFITFIVLIMSINPALALGCADAGFMGTFQQDTNVTITETCPTCTFINITLKNTTSDIVFNNQPMALTGGTFEYNITSGNHSELGTYFVEGYSNLDNPFKACYVITNIKVETSEAEATLYVVLMILSLFVFIFSLWGSVVLPFSNPRNALGRVIDISWVKYFKISLIAITFLMFLWIMNLGVTITENSVSLTQFSGFFTMIFTITTASIWPLLVLMFILMSILIIKDLQLNKLLKRGLTPR